MQHHALLAMAVGALALLACGTTSSQAGEEERTARMETTASRAAKARYYRNRRPMEVTIYPTRRRLGGYSYGGIDANSTYGASPAPYTHTRQTPNGPFDNGFFFDSGVSDVGVGTRGGDSPYMR
jgi:hypothetical protein